MKRNTIVAGAVLAIAIAAPDLSAMDATLSADGLIRFAQAADYAIRPMLFLPGWRGAQLRGGYEIKRPGVAVYRLEESGEVLADATTSLKQLDGGKASAVFTITPRKDVETISFGCTVSFPSAEVDGKPWCIDGKRGTFAKPDKGITLAWAKTTFAEFPSGANGSQVRIEAPRSLDCLVQDNRKWGETYSIRIGDLSTRVLKAGVPLSFEFVISSKEPVVAADQRPYVIKAGKDWIPIVEHRDILEGSALDFSKAGFVDAPAGKYGWLRNVDGHFEFERLPGRPQRFYGVNFCGTANFPDHDLADTLVTRLKRFGYNALRLHHHDAGTVEGSADGLTLNPENMDRFDYLLAAAIREGIYLTTDIFVSRSRVIKWRHIGVDRDGLVDMQLFKALCAVYDPAFENWAAYAKNFMEHRNKYTGRRYADEPALSLVSLVNEGGFFMGWTRGVSDDPRIVASWRAWMKAKRDADPSFAEGVDGEALPKSYWDGKSRSFVAQWCAELETKMVARMKAYLRSLGVRALITNDNCGPHYVAKNGLVADWDYIDDHFYVDHPSFLEKRWQLPSRCHNVNPLLGKKPVVPVEREFPFVKGKPLTVTEWNFSGPGRYRGVGGILTGATAALKDMDGLWRFAYSHSRNNLGDSDIRAPGYFDLASDQLSLASDRASICLFLRRDIEPGADASLKMDRTRGSFTIDTPRTVGGFAPEGTIEAGVLRAMVAGAPATVCVHSLDGEPVAKSRRMLLTHLTDVQGDGERFADESMTVLLKWGSRPLAQNGSAEISLALDSPAKYEVWELAANGARLRRVESDVANGRLRFTATVAGPDGARMLYEIFAKFASTGEIVRDGTFARWDERTLSVGNGLFEAKFRMRGGILRTVSLVAGGVERLGADEGNACDELAVAEADAGWSAAGDRELALSVSSGGKTATVRVWPRASGPVVEQPHASPLPARPGAKEWGSPVFSFAWNRFKSLGACGDALYFAAPHLMVRAFTPMDRTDLRAELLDEREFAMPTSEAMAYLKCNVLDVRETLSGRGVVFLKLAPMPESRANPDAVDFAVNPATRAVMAVPTGDPLAMLAYSGGEVGRLRALRDFHRSLWPCRPGRDGVLLSNTWGDGNRDSRVNEEFLLKEIAAAADIGVEVVQIDDGWQKGRSSNSSQSRGKGVWNGYWAADPEFWAPDPVRFPRGLKPLADAAGNRGLSIGLWFGPDSSDDAANWERDADCLLAFHRQYGIRHFKIDSLKLHTPTAFARNRGFFAKMLRESDGRMCFDLDCTAEVRPGFLGGMPVGPLFAENRYAHRKGDMRVYYPHQTLRSLWTLSHVLDPVRLRMEFLNPAKKDGAYGDDPLRPSEWPADALFAITMLSSPLAWMELSDVPEAVRAKWRPLIAKWKRERDALHSCVTVPVGGKPDGESWTGFVSVGDGGGYALIFREGNAMGDWQLDLRDYFPSEKVAASVISGNGTASVADGRLKVDIPGRFGYLWLSLLKN